ncbi:hypothetical protein QJS66_07145 [Kocuria rhizophila]|nr:hypothetical protein QJS66_07145 [Kocuria rhizophila]
MPIAYYTFGGWKPRAGDLNQHGTGRAEVLTPRPRPSPRAGPPDQGGRELRDAAGSWAARRRHAPRGGVDAAAPAVPPAAGPRTTTPGESGAPALPLP